WQGSGAYGVTSLAISAQQLDVAILGQVAGAVPAGIYSSVNRWTQPMGLIASSFAGAATPFVAGAESWRAGLRYALSALWLLGLAVLVCAVMAIIAPFVVPWLLGDAYLPATPVLRMLAIACVPMVLSQPLFVVLQ